MFNKSEPKEVVDPRVRRTRLMLFESLKGLLLENDFERVSVHDIAERAALNRATVYDHYPDKFALLECMIGQQLKELINKRGLHFEGCDGALRKVALVVCPAHLHTSAYRFCNRRRWSEIITRNVVAESHVGAGQSNKLS